MTISGEGIDTLQREIAKNKIKTIRAASGLLCIFWLAADIKKKTFKDLNQFCYL